MTEFHTASIQCLREIRTARGQEQDGADVTDDPEKTRNALAWTLRRQTPKIDDALRTRAQEACDGLWKEVLGLT